MPKNIVPFTLNKIGALGINKGESDYVIPVGFATEAENLVFNNSGSLESRKGFVEEQTDADVSSEIGTGALHYYLDKFDAVAVLIISRASGANVYLHTYRVADDTIAEVFNEATTYDVNSQWICILNGNAYIKIYGNTTLYRLTPASNQSKTNLPGTYPSDTTCISNAHGHLWIYEETLKTLYWGSTVLSPDWTSPNSLSLSEYWPTGEDNVVAIKEWNNFLIVFGRDNILIYGEATRGNGWSGSNVVLIDGIKNIGCVAEASIDAVGDELWFLSRDGLKRITRIAAEGSSLGVLDVNKHINEYTSQWADYSQANGAYNPKDGFYLLNFKNGENSLVFDSRPVQVDGDIIYRCTEWNFNNIENGKAPADAIFDYKNNVFYVLINNGLYKYDAGYNDDASATYDISYKGAWNDFGQEVSAYQKIPKHLTGSMSGTDDDTITVYWYQNFDDSTEYSATDSLTDEKFKVPLSGSGEVLKVGFSATINGSKKVLKKYNVLAKIGRL